LEGVYVIDDRLQGKRMFTLTLYVALASQLQYRN
jgi:hypothetical protein